jgi:hypothetical protein
MANEADFLRDHIVVSGRGPTRPTDAFLEAMVAGIHKLDAADERRLLARAIADRRKKAHPDK